MSENAKTKLEIIFVIFEEILFLLSYLLASKGLLMRKPKHNRRLRRREPSSTFNIHLLCHHRAKVKIRPPDMTIL